MADSGALPNMAAASPLRLARTEAAPTPCPGNTPVRLVSRALTPLTLPVRDTALRLWAAQDHRAHMEENKFSEHVTLFFGMVMFVFMCVWFCDSRLGRIKQNCEYWILCSMNETIYSHITMRDHTKSTTIVFLGEFGKIVFTMKISRVEYWSRVESYLNRFMCSHAAFERVFLEKQWSFSKQL